MTTIPSSFRFTHLRYNDNGQVSGMGGATIAYDYEPNEKRVRAAVAFCHPNDRFNKSLGRVKAAGRLVSFQSAPTKRDGFRFFELQHVEPDQVNDAVGDIAGDVASINGYTY